MEATMKNEAPAQEPRRSLRDAFAALPRGKPERVDMRRFPDAPQDVFVKPPAAAHVAAWEHGGIEYGKGGRVKIKHSPTRKAELIAMCVCDESGSLVWNSTDVKNIAKMDAPIVNHLFEAAKRAAGQGAADDLDEEDEELEGN